MGNRTPRSPTYASWIAMRQRCNDPNKNRSKHYALRGITYDSSWENFTTFLTDMGCRVPGTSLDRIDPEKGYSKTNCRWATNKQQQNNRRNNRVLVYQGVSRTLTEWAEELGINKYSLSTRIQRGWSAERALSEPVKISYRRKTA